MDVFSLVASNLSPQPRTPMSAREEDRYYAAARLPQLPLRRLAPVAAVGVMMLVLMFAGPALAPVL